MQEPKIVYKQIIINNTNVGEFLEAQKAAEYRAASNSIILYDYSLSDDLGFGTSKKVRKIINHIRKERSYSLEHETQHWRNQSAVGDAADIANRNYYQEILLYCMDELSAFTAAAFYTNRHLTCRGACADSIVIAMHSGISEFVYGAGTTCYLQNMVRWVHDFIMSDLKRGFIDIAHLQRLQTRKRRNPNGLFGKRYHNAVKKYFTFDGYCIMDDKLSGYALGLWNEIQIVKNDIQSIYMHQLSQTIDDIIATHSR